MLSKQLENEYLLNIQKQYPKDIFPLPGYQDIGYNIDLSTRTIQSPEFLSVEKDHNSEIKYFVVDRYIDHQDLSDTICIIQYKNAKGQELVYPIPFFDTYTLRNENKMILPWNISGSASIEAGDITYSFRFYKFETFVDNNGKITYGNLIYNLSTLPATSKILYGLNINILDEEEVNFSAKAYDTLVGMINDDTNKVIYWNLIN